jgi:hypothetical protein
MNPFEPEETDVDRQTNVIFRQQRLAIEHLEQQVKDLKASAGLWEYYAGLQDAERKFLVESYDNGHDLTNGLRMRMGRPLIEYRYPGNDERLNEEAGHAADAYRGEGWMKIRNMLVNFHHRMTKLGI